MIRNGKTIEVIKLVSICLLLILSTSGIKASEDQFIIRDYGAVRDGKSSNTEAIDKAIEAASEANRGKVYWYQNRDLNPAILLQHFSIVKKSIFSIYELTTKRLSHC